MTMRRDADKLDAVAATMLISIVVVSVLAIALAAGSMYIATRESVEYRCVMDDDFISFGTVTLARSDATFIPLGRACTWAGSAGDEFTIVTGWPTTISAWIASGVLIVGALIARRRGSTGVRRTVAVGVAAAVALWALMAWGAAAF